MSEQATAPTTQRKGRRPLTPGDPRHGTYNGYINHGCRCDACKKANTDYCREMNHRLGRHRPQGVVFAERRATADARDNHGTESRYRFGCRCDECREAHRIARARRRANRDTGGAMR